MLNVSGASVLVAAPGADPDYLGFGNVIHLPTKWVAFSRLGTVHVDKGVIVTAESTTGESAWGALATILSDATDDLRDPCATILQVPPHAGRVVLSLKHYDHTAPSSVLNGGRVIYSDDGLVSWSPQYTLPDGFTEWSGCASPPCELDDGELLQALFGTNLGDPGTHLRLVRSPNGGATFGNEVVMATDPGTGKRYEEPQLFYWGGDEVVCLARVREVDATINTYRAVSLDRGANWSAFTYLFENRGAPRGKAFGTSGLIMVGRQPSRANGQVSFDKGVTWSTKQDIDTVTSYATMNYAGLDVYADGSFGCLYACEMPGGLVSSLRFKRLFVVPA